MGIVIIRVNKMGGESLIAEKRGGKSLIEDKKNGRKVTNRRGEKK